MAMSELPKSWVDCQLEEILLALESGSRPKGGVRNINEGIPSIGGEHLNYRGSFNFSNVRYVPKTFADKMTKGKIQIEDILVVKDGATTGKTAMVNEFFPFNEAVVNEHVFICRTSKLIDPKFVFRFLTSKDGQNNILENFQGSAQGGINTKFVSNTTIPLAPLNEQKRIVKKLDKLLTQVDESKRRLEKIPVIIKRFRQSVLNAAVTGELTKDWREKNDLFFDEEELLNLRENIYLEKFDVSKAKKIINSESKEFTLLIRDDLPNGWKFINLYYLSDPTRAFSYGVIKLGNETKNGISCLRTSNLKVLYIDFTNVKKISREIADNYHRTYLRGNELLISVRGTLGGICVVPPIAKGFNISREIAMVAILEKLINPYYVAIYIASGVAQSWLKEVYKGVAYTGINIEDLKNLPISVPSLEEQKEIVKRVKALFKKADEIEERYKKAKAYVDKLTQSILAKAFRGELVPQDPSDEPAEKLLERVKAEKEKVSKENGKRKKVIEELIKKHPKAMKKLS